MEVLEPIPCEYLGTTLLWLPLGVGGVVFGKRIEEGFWESESILFLDISSGYMTSYITFYHLLISTHIFHVLFYVYIIFHNKNIFYYTGHVSLTFQFS